MKKIKPFVKVAVVGAIIGFLMSILIHEGLWFKLIQGFKNISVFLYIPIIILLIFLNVLFHELGHLFSFLLSGVKIRALYVFIFILKKDFDNKWKFEVDFKNFKFLGGMVVPNLEPITKDQEYDLLRKKFSKALLDGPIASLIHFVISLLIFLIVWIITDSYLFIGLLAINFIVTLLMTILIMLSSRLHTDELYGDFFAYKKMKEDDTFCLVQLIQYRGFSLFEDNDSYLYEKGLEHIKRNPTQYKMFDLVLVTYIINEYLDKDEVCNTIEEITNEYNIISLARNKHGLELAYLIASVYYKIGDVKKSYDTFNEIIKVRNRYVDKDMQNFLLKQYEHLINRNDNTTYLTENIEVYFKEYHIMLPIINKKVMMSELIKQLPFSNYQTAINVENEKDE